MCFTGLLLVETSVRRMLALRPLSPGQLALLFDFASLLSFLFKLPVKNRIKSMSTPASVRKARGRDSLAWTSVPRAWLMMKILQVAGGLSVSWVQREKNSVFNGVGEDSLEENVWDELDSDLYYWTKPLRPVQVLFALVS